MCQSTTEEPASKLLERIRDEKKRLVKEGKIKKQISLPPISDEEIPFEIPESWEWVRLDSICEYIQRGKSPKYSLNKKYPVISQKCNQWNGFSIEKAKFIEPTSISSYGPERILQNDDLMWNSTGLGTLGRIAMYKAVLNPYELAVADSHVTVIRSLCKYVFSDYLYYYFSNPSVQNIIEVIADGTTKQKELSTATIKAYLVPLPPLSEQRRIVQKIESIMPLLNEYHDK
jgi:type I restriction enzyme, S subunit